MSLLDTDHTPVYSWLAAAERGELRSQPSGVSSGSLGYGAGGPVWLDAYHSKRPPSPPELVNAFKSVAYACIRLNFNGLGKVPLRLYATTGPQEVRPRRAYRPVQSDRELKYLRKLPHVRRSIRPEDSIDEIVDHPILDAFNDPNPYFDSQLLIQYLSICLDVIGICYLFPERPNPKVAPSEIWPLQSQYVFPVKGYDREVIKCYQFFGETFQPDELVRIRWMSMRDPYMSGYAPLHACFEQSGLGDYYTAAVESILKGGPRPSWFVSPKDALSVMGEPERKAFERDLTRRLSGGGSGRLLVGDGSYDLTALDYKPTDLGGLEITQFQRLTVANCFDVPISMLQAEDSNKAVASEGTRQHQTLAIEPRCRLIGSALTQQLCRPIDRRLFLAFDNPVDSDRELDSTVQDRAIKNGTKTINQANLDNNMPPVAWGDEPWQSNTLIQPSQAAELAAQQAEAHAAGLDNMAAETAATAAGDDDDEQDDDEKAQRSALLLRAKRLLRRISRDLPAGGGGRRALPGNAQADEPAPGEGGRAGPARGQHPRPAQREADPADLEEVVQEAGEGDPRDDSHDWEGTPEHPTVGHELRRSDGGGDDAPDLGLLGPGGQDDPGQAGPGHRGVAGHRSAPEGRDPDGQPEVLQPDERDHDGQAPGRPGDPPD